MMHGWGFGGGRGYPQRFEEQYHCYSVAYADKPQLEKGDKILLPPSAFDTLARLQVDYPMLFQLSSETKGTMTHSGVLEFTAEEGSCYIPFWMMQNLLIEEGTVITVTNISLPKATFVKLQPQHEDFLEISNPRAVLEHALRNFSCVTKGDVIQLPYNGKYYHFLLKEVLPQDAACIIETDCNVDFDAPVGYKEPERVHAPSNETITSSSRSAGGGLPITKQSAFLDRSSSCPSPAASSTSAMSDGKRDEEAPTGIRIVDGKIVRPSDHQILEQQQQPHAMLAEKTGSTGVQRNAAIPVQAPKVDYWAVQAGDGARLDGKQPSALKDKDGTELDVAKVRADAAAKRAADAAREEAAAAVQSKRKSKVGAKFSKLKPKAAAFQGHANSM
ncbi:Ubiquitin fusion degradation protein UFD1 [Fragilaria crotonensis]|nr:Ubiquitin fusion degradation protein UFD1 [Fragilaria crotonensis]